MVLAMVKKFFIRLRSLIPGVLSTPDDTSSVLAPLDVVASKILLALRPPANIHGSGILACRSNVQSKDIALPPGRIFFMFSGALESNNRWSATS